MSDQPETIAAILAEFRAFALRAAEWDKMISPESVLLLADKVEAAAERERESLQGTIDKMRRAIAENTPGNAAAMRDALSRVGHLAKDLRNITERDTEVRADANEIVDVCRAAIAAPARNCDRCEFWEDLWGLEFVKLWPDVTDDLQRAWLFVRWLFAPAEGGSHA